MKLLFSRLFSNNMIVLTALLIGVMLLLSNQFFMAAYLLLSGGIGIYVLLLQQIKQEQKSLLKILAINQQDQVYTGINKLLSEHSITMLLPLLSAITQFNKQYQRDYNEVKNQNLEIGYSAKELSNNADDTAKQSDIQHQNCLTTATATAQINVTLADISRRIEDINRAVNDAKDNCQHSFKTLVDSKQQVSQVNDVIINTQQSLQQLKDKLDTVILMSNVVSEMAAQTNLLSINASIEAAKAGEYGRGFSVVASEMKMLAQRSQTSAQTITNKTKEVTENMHVVESYMQDAIEHIDQSGINVESACGNLNHIVNMTENMAVDIDGVAVATDQQMHALNDITQAVEQLTVLAEQNSHMSMQQANVANHLHHITRIT
ncbi:MAG: methyl-accepting chemotaxis protein [Moritella sp.]|uniref:methyl-accepting chemotaxis protein n=1 Tax=Moritella sp. TaxID=78556 RepID=UPI0029ADBA7F|nr:methyl-accepting chemotaxis protein [Moritella sp.]MDX2321736.1 methyl-accepting chemotaxis protein [Moritella sp.]